MPPKVTVDDRVRLLAAIIRFSVVGGDWEMIGMALNTTPRAAEERWKSLRGSEVLLKGITASSVDMKLSRHVSAPAKKGKGKTTRDLDSGEDSEPDMGNLSISNDKSQKSTKQKSAAGRKKAKSEPKVESSDEEKEDGEEEDEAELSGGTDA